MVRSILLLVVLEQGGVRRWVSRNLVSRISQHRALRRTPWGRCGCLNLRDLFVEDCLRRRTWRRR